MVRLKNYCRMHFFYYASVMDIKVFRTFIEVANTRHFGRAADNLYITQAAVSARIKQLEEFYTSHFPVFFFAS